MIAVAIVRITRPSPYAMVAVNRTVISELVIHVMTVATAPVITSVHATPRVPIPCSLLLPDPAIQSGYTENFSIAGFRGGSFRSGTHETTSADFAASTLRSATSAPSSRRGPSRAYGGNARDGRDGAGTYGGEEPTTQMYSAVPLRVVNRSRGRRLLSLAASPTFTQRGLRQLEVSPTTDGLTLTT